MSKEIKETLVSFKVAELAKKKGFSVKTINCFASFPTSSEKKYRRMNTYFSSKIGEKDSFGNKLTLIAYRPSTDLLQKWLREVHRIDIAVNLETIDDSTTEYTYEIVQYIPEGFNRKKDTWDFYKRICSFTPSGGWYSSYEEAREEALLQALNLLPDVKIQ